MKSVIAVGFGLEWANPVVVQDAEGKEKRLFGPRAGLKYLTDECEIRSGQTYWSAVSACNAALLYRGDLDRSRSHFIAAYAEYMFKVRN